MKLVKENISFERGRDPKSSMEVGLKSKYGEMYDIFIDCHNLAGISENFEWVSDITSENDKIFFNIDSFFYYTDQEDNKISEKFVVFLFSDCIHIKNVITDETYDIKRIKRFIEITTCFDEVPESFLYR